MLEAEKVALTRELAHYKQEAMRAVAEKKEVQDNLASVKDELATAEDVKLQIVKDMTRQYKSMQENLMKQITEAHDTIEKLKVSQSGRLAGEAAVQWCSDRWSTGSAEGKVEWDAVKLESTSAGVGNGGGVAFVLLLFLVRRR
jgi:hypothetical protein